MAVGVKANVRIRKYDNLGRLRQESRAQNLVVDAGLDFIADYFFYLLNSSIIVVAYGSDDTAADAGDTALGSQYDIGTGVYASTGTGICTITKSFAITATETAKEAGLLSDDATPVLFARATFTTVNLSDGDVLEVEWTITYTDGG